MKKTIFLTGSKGFIGSHLLPALHEYDVICGGHNELPVGIPDYIIHLAATTTTTDAFLPELYENNIIYAKQIMSIPTRIIYASSTSVTQRINPYAYTKCYIEHLGFECNATGLRFFNVYGPNNNKGIVKKAIECIKSGKTMVVWGGYNTRDFIYVDDVVKAIINSLDTHEKIIEVGTGIGTSIEKALAKICDVMDLELNIDWRPPLQTDMKYSIAHGGIPGCLSFEDGLKKMLNG